MVNDTGRAIDALHAIPSGLDRDTWHKIGRAGIAAGLTIENIDEWSQTAGNYGGSKDVHSAFRTITAEGGTGPGTLYKIAAEYGWRMNGDKPLTKPSPKPISRPIEAPARLSPKVSAAKIWERCEPATSTHPYIVEKQASAVPLDSLRVLPAGDALRIAGESMAGALVVPVSHTDGTLSSLQFIALPNVAKRLKSQGKPGKLNLPSASMEGLHVVGELVPGGVAYICEGIGTAWACWQATGAAAVVCFGSGRVARVAADLREADKATRLVLVPDAGKEADAEKIARTVNAAVAYMPDGSPDNFDANDLAKSKGMDVLRALLHSAQEPSLPPPMLKPVSVSDVLTNPAPPPQFVWDGYLPRGVVSLLGAHGGTGKSTIAMMLGVCAALGRPLFGVDTVQCKTLFVSLEDSAHIVRHRLASICRTWGIDPAQLDNKLNIVDGTENPELFSADSRGAGDTTATYLELCRLVQSEGVGLVVVDNASDAYGGDEIQRRQVRAFIRSMVEVARLTNCAVMLLAHVDKNTSRARKAEGGEGYSGSTAWHNSARSRLFMTRTEMDTLKLEHQKSNLGKLREALTLEWPEAGLPQLMGNEPADNPLNPFMQRVEGREEDERAIRVLRMLAEFEGRQQYCSPSPTARNNVFAMLKSEPAFQKLKLNADRCKRIVNQCQRAKWIEPVEYRARDRKSRDRWTLTTEGRAIAGLSAPCAPSAPRNNESAQSAGGAPCAPSCVGGVGE
jgi:putative DNA primase/helicase